MENNNPVKKTRSEYYEATNTMGKKEFTLLKMQEYGFWPADIKTPYEIKENESKEDYNKRKELLVDYNNIAKQMAELYTEKGEIVEKLNELRTKYSKTWDNERIRKDIAQQIMQESLKRRAEKKKQKELEKIRISEEWKNKKAENIVFIGKGYSNLLFDKISDDEKLLANNLPIIKDDKELATLLEIDYKQLRFLAYHRDVVVTDNYNRYTIPKRSGGERNIAAPKPILKNVQRKILSLILEKIEIDENAHGFLKGKSVVSSAYSHTKQPALLINIDLENFFPTVTFERVRGMFKAFGYSGYIASLLAMLCTYCERMPVEIKGVKKYIKTTERILPQGAPSSPMITNILCKRLDLRINELSKEYLFKYSRYADDMSFTFDKNSDIDKEKIKKIVFYIQCIVNDEGFRINKEKTRYLKKNNRQCITGIVINNEQMGVPKKWLKKMRAAIYNANKLKQDGKLPSSKVSEILGMSFWLMSVNPEKYKDIIEEAKNLSM